LDVFSDIILPVAIWL